MLQVHAHACSQYALVVIDNRRVQHSVLLNHDAPALVFEFNIHYSLQALVLCKDYSVITLNDPPLNSFTVTEMHRGCEVGVATLCLCFTGHTRTKTTEI